MMILHMTPDEYIQLQDGIDRASLSAPVERIMTGEPFIDPFPILVDIVGEDVARQVYGCVRVEVHWDGVITERVTT